MTKDESLAKVAELLDAETWIAVLVSNLASASCQVGHTTFAADLKCFQRITDEALDNFRFEMAHALHLSMRYPDLFKDPETTLKLIEGVEGE